MWLSSSMLRALDIIIRGPSLSVRLFSNRRAFKRTSSEPAPRYSPLSLARYLVPPPSQTAPSRSSLQFSHAGPVLYSDPASTFSPSGLAVPIGITFTSVPPPATVPQAAATLLYSPASHRRTSHSRPGLSLASRTTSRAINPASTSFDASQIYSLISSYPEGLEVRGVHPVLLVSPPPAYTPSSKSVTTT